MSTEAGSDGDIVVLRHVRWETYCELRDDPAHERVRMSYHQGRLELMSPSGPHERIKRLLERLIDAWCDVHQLPVSSFGSTTYRKEDSSAGLEPDSCYYLESEPLVRHKDEIDLTIDPPPDLAIEVDLTSNSAGRLPIYAALGVPEVWRTNGDWIQLYRLEDDRYTVVEQSSALPGLAPAVLAEFLALRTSLSERQLIHDFQSWAAQQSPTK